MGSDNDEEGLDGPRGGVEEGQADATLLSSDPDLPSSRLSSAASPSECKVRISKSECIGSDFKDRVTV